MKKFLSAFIFRGLVACGFGPLVLAVVYMILQRCVGLEALTVGQICVGIFSLSALAFVSGGINAIYQIERLPLMIAISIHGAVLYGGYLGTYLVNSWLAQGTAPILVFSAIFFLGFLLIWVIIFTVTKRSTARINEKLRQKQPLLHRSRSFPRSACRRC